MYSLRILNYSVFGLYRILVYSEFGLYRILVYSEFGLYRILVYSGFDLDKFHCMPVCFVCQRCFSNIKYKCAYTLTFVLVRLTLFI